MDLYIGFGAFSVKLVGISRENKEAIHKLKVYYKIQKGFCSFYAKIRLCKRFYVLFSCPN